MRRDVLRGVALAEGKRIYRKVYPERMREELEPRKARKKISNCSGNRPWLPFALV